MRLATTILLAAAAAASLAATASAATLAVDARANIYGAGHASPPEPGGGGAGVSPAAYSFSAAPGLILTFTSVTGVVGCCNVIELGVSNGPDGGTWASGTTDITSYGGISGIVDADRTLFLVGVFTNGTEPSDPAPARLDFSESALGHSFTTLSPALGQVFFIGDGRTGTGSGPPQSFAVPADATRLYLGFADAVQFGDPISPPGYYGDNQGSLEATFQLTGATPTQRQTWASLKLLYR